VKFKPWAHQFREKRGKDGFESRYDLTFNQTMMRFQNPTILISMGEYPTQALRSLIATTYM